ncbi:sulfotransferase [Zhongshania sp.]|uniref:sulfotransferase n=1 Tax=Zhongshania sp. TaxID=1971902 RepID=UPI003567ABA2
MENTGFLGEPLFILGMHRSGTTMLSKMLVESGYYPGWSLEENNEPTYIIKKNNEILHSAGCNWDFPYHFQSYLTDRRRKYLCEWLMQDILSFRSVTFFGPAMWLRRERMLNDKRNLLVKDPRSSITFPIWKMVFPNLKVLHIRRHGVDVAKSLAVRAEKMLAKRMGEIPLPRGLRVDDIRYGLELWDFYEKSCNDAMSSVAPGHVLSVSYEDILTTPDKTFAQIEQFLNVRFSPESKAKVNSGRAYSFVRDLELVALSEEYSDVLKAHGYSAGEAKRV